MKNKSFADILCDISDAGLERVRRKVPEWTDVPGLTLPSQLCTEQCSSSATALYKASLISRLPLHSRIVDLTGGLGVDCWAFSSVADSVHHNEMDPALSEAVQANFRALGLSNVTFSCKEVTPATLGEVLGVAGCGANDAADIIYLDPARRDAAGRKVFLLEDCSPDILTLKDLLLDAAPHVLVKLSPMADISMVCRRLGAQVKEVHVLGASGECKELLVLLERGWDGGCSITVCPDCAHKENTFTFNSGEESAAEARLHASAEELSNATILFEPSAAVLKAGCFRLLCERWHLTKLGRSTQLYTLGGGAAAQAETETGTEAQALKPYGKLFTINKIIPFCGANIKAVGKENKRCEVSARNLPISSEELKKRMGVTSGGDTHVFAFSADFLSGKPERLMAVCTRRD